MSLFTIDKITQKDTKPVMERRGSSALPDHRQQSFDTMLPNLAFLQNEPSPLHQNISPDKNGAERTTSPISSTSSSPRSPDSQGVGSPVDKNKKPQHSYIALIAMAIIDSPNKRLLLCDIYQYIQKNFPFYRNNDRSWRNSIRHNLSLNECFIKCGRSGDGRGNFWGIHPANVEDFARGDYRRRRARRRVRAAHELSYHLYHPYSAPIAAAAYSPPHAHPVGFVPMSCTSFPPYSVVPPAPFYPPPVSVPYTMPHVMQKPSSYPPAVPTAAAPVSSINSISAPIPSCSLTSQLRRSPDQHIIPVSPSVSPPSASPPSVFPSSCELSKTVRPSSVSSLHVPSASPMYSSLPYSAAPASSGRQYPPHSILDRSALHSIYSAWTLMLDIL